MMEIPFIDLNAQYKRIAKDVLKNIDRVLSHGRFILGPEVNELEDRLAAYVGTSYCVSCSSGTDALLMSLMALDVHETDVVFTSPFTFMATAEVIALTGAIPVFVDIDPKTYNINPDGLKRAIQAVKNRDNSIYPIPEIILHKEFNLTGIIGVDLFGICAEYREINNIALENHLFVIEDGAQSFGGKYFGKMACSLAHIGCTSFFPAKPLGAYGDGGAIFTDSEELADIMRSIRVHGEGRDKYENIRLGINGRMDTIQAAVLLAKLDIFDEEINKRQEVAQKYSARLDSIPNIKLPNVPEHILSAWAQYCILVEERDELIEFLKGRKIPTNIYYKTPLHLQRAFSYLGYKEGDMGVSEQVSKEIVALPMHPYLKDEILDYIVESIFEFYK